MEKVIDAVMTIACALLIAAGGHYGLKQITLWVRRAALTKVALGLPPLSPFTRKLTGLK